MRNIGDESIRGAKTVTATLPPGLSFVAAEGSFSCSGATAVTCTNAQNVNRKGYLILLLRVAVSPATTPGVHTAEFSVEGGEGLESHLVPAPASTADPVTVSSEPTPFGIEGFDVLAADSVGLPYTRAGGHPTDYRAWLDVNTHDDPSIFKGARFPVEPVKDVLTRLPVGLVGNPTAVPTCTVGQLTNLTAAGELESLCPAASQVGTATVRHNGNAIGFAFTNNVIFGPVPVYNMAAPPGAAANFGFLVGGTVVFLQARLQQGGDYALTVNSNGVSEGLPIDGVGLDFWGVPSDQGHTPERSCPGELTQWQNVNSPGCASGAPAVPFFRMPTACTAAGEGLATSVAVDSWTTLAGSARTAKPTPPTRPGRARRASATCPPPTPTRPGNGENRSCSKAAPKSR